ncbi:hypothetical protein BD410DRAFT_787444 [Rickenella mellea]|uniref:histone acetyltransferase n=1 Tax=Rickenella mellea TaxID=50990 RepID=A0A4Y7Q745_9AGAM|nr:hypothetical protein BD410DRAFT_787444 [Rickenella mellea]
MSLRNVLLDALSKLPGERTFHIHVLVSAPRRYGLYPYASVRHRIYVNDILILLAEQPPNEPVSRVFVSGIHAAVYTIPSTASAILYVSKVDGTGQGASPSPTATLIRALISFYVDPTTRPVPATHLWVHLFARAQNQYLFPNSSEHPRKRVLTDVQLCMWWKRIFSDVARNVGDKLQSVKLHYTLPGYDQLEARQALGGISVANPPRDAAHWNYGHPYSQTDVPLPYISRGGSSSRQNLGQFIPSFDDDPKSRFMDEIACTNEGDLVKSPPRKRARTNDDERKDKEESRPAGELGHVSVDDFWERMSFRQECVAGAVTAFFVGVFSSAPPAPDAPPVPTHLSAQPGQVSHHMIKRLVSSLLTGVEFSNSERAIRGTQILEGSIKGLCDGLASNGPERPSQVATPSDESGRRTPEREAAVAPPPPQTPPRRVVAYSRDDDVTPNPFPEAEPVTSLETYHSHIYGSVLARNSLIGLKDGRTGAEAGLDTARPAEVTILPVRRKPKKR